MFFIWIIPVTLVIYGVINSPKSIEKSDIVGTYEIDNEFYSGANANWQKNLFSFTINENNEFYFYEKLADGGYKITEGKIIYSLRKKPKTFRIKLSNPHKLIDEYPSLYREKFGFYYVFDSAFGSMFYRKVSANTANKVLHRKNYSLPLAFFR